MIFRAEMPPTAGLPARFADFLPPLPLRSAKQRLLALLSEQFSLPPLQLECSGTASLILALKTLQAMPQNKGRDEVVIPAYNCPLVVLAVAHCGLKPRLCDTAPDSFDFDSAALPACLGGRTLALMPTHLGGQAADVGGCAPLARQCGAFIIEDAAQAALPPPRSAIGRRGDISFFSLAVGKGLTLYEGGLLTAETAAMRAALRETSRRLVPFRPLWEARRLAELFAYACFYRPRALPFVYGAPRRRALAKGQWEEAASDVFSPNIPLHRVSGLRAACGLRAAARLAEFLRQTQAQAARRLPALQALAEKSGGRLKLVGAARADKALWPYFMLLMPDAASRKALLRRLWPSPDGVSPLFIHALHDYAYLQPFLREPLANAAAPLPNARAFAARLLTISNSLWLEDSRFEKLCHIIEQALDIGSKAA